MPQHAELADSACASDESGVKAPAMDFISQPPPSCRSPAHADEVREFIGVEIEPKYFDIACERIAAAYAQGQLFK